MIPFNKPYITGNEINYITDVINSRKISGDGLFTKKCQEFFRGKYSFDNNLLTTSCTDALEMIAILLRIEPGDEVIMPSYTFVSTANAFVLRGAKVIFADSSNLNPNITIGTIEPLITKRTKAIILVHYAGIACEMNSIMDLAARYNLYVVEDAAQCIDSYYLGKPLGSIGQFSAFSFHDTKNIIAGEGGLCVINDQRYARRAEIIREKGTNRSSFFRGEVDKYGWVDCGSSFLPSELIAAFLYGQLENISLIQSKRLKIWNSYKKRLSDLNNIHFILQDIPYWATNNAHMFYIVCNSLEDRISLISYLKTNGVAAVFHYNSLHSSEYYIKQHDGRGLKYSDLYSERLLRLPLYYDLMDSDVDYICDLIFKFYSK